MHWGNTMTIDAVYAEAVKWLVRVIALALMVVVAVKVLNLFGVRLPISLPIDYVSMAYLAGTWWLVRKAG